LEKKEQFIDFRWKKTNYSKFFNDEELSSLAKVFTEQINFCHYFYKDKLDWWFQSLSARNNFASPLFHHFICFNICKRLSTTETFPQKCVTDSNELYRGLIYLKKIGMWKGNCLHTRKRNLFSRIAKRLKVLLIASVHFFVPFVIIRCVHLGKKKNLEKPITLIDTFMMPGQEEKNRYYQGVTDQLTDLESKEIRFVPTFFGYSLRDYLSSITLLSKNRNKFLFREDFLQLSDYIVSLFHSIRVLFLPFPSLKTHVFDLGAQIKEELGLFGGFENAALGFLNAAFAKRLRLSNIKIKACIDWNENQGQDRGWNYGFNKFHPTAKTIGYAPYSISQWHLSISPLAVERSFGVLPKTFRVPSDYMIPVFKTNDPKTEVKTTGAFRFEKVRRQTTPKKRIPRILIPLPMDEHFAIEIYKQVHLLFSSIKFTSFVLVFKEHPAFRSIELDEIKINRPEEINEIWSNENLGDEMMKCDAVISSWTSSLLEACWSDIPVAIICTPDGLFHNPIPKEVNFVKVTCLDTPESLNSFLITILESDRPSSKSACKILETPSRSAALELLGL
jgi:hypothetical protein